MGHGTMVASVAASSNGVAPGALLGSYRVFGCSGFASDDVIIEAIDLAVSDGCDIINLALSTGSGYDEQVSWEGVMSLFAVMVVSMLILVLPHLTVIECFCTPESECCVLLLHCLLPNKFRVCTAL